MDFYAVDESIPIDQFPQFFEDARLNWAENILCGNDDDLMITSMNETTLDEPEKYTWADMRRLVAEYADALKRAGLREGDFMVCMAGLLPFHSDDGALTKDSYRKQLREIISHSTGVCFDRRHHRQLCY